MLDEVPIAPRDAGGDGVRSTRSGVRKLNMDIQPNTFIRFLCPRQRIALSLVAIAVAMQQAGPSCWAQASASTSTPGTRAASAIYPLDGVVDSEQSVWVVDRNVPGVWKWSAGKLELAIQGEKKFRQRLNAARCIAISPSGEMVLGDPATREVYRRGSDGTLAPSVSGAIGIPMDLAFASDGTLYIADVERRVVWKQTNKDEKPTVFAEVNPRGLFVDAKDRLWVVSQDASQLIRLSPDGTKEVVVKERTFEFPHQVVVDSHGTAWVTDGYKKGLWRIPEGQTPELAFSGEPLQNPVGIFLFEDRPVVVDPHAQGVFKWDDGKLQLWFKLEKK